MTEESRPPGSVIATVQAVYTVERYVFTTEDGTDKSITFTLTGEVWMETEPPTVGARVILEDIREWSRGPRAFKARFHRYKPG